MAVTFSRKPLVVEDDGGVSLDFTEFYSAREVNVPPSLNDIQSAFGMPADVGSGRFAFLDAAGLGTDVYLCVCDGTNWFYTAMTKAVD